MQAGHGGRGRRAVRGGAVAARRRAVVFFETIEHLTQLADDAYALARAEVFDVEPPGGDPKRRTRRQRALVGKLETVEQELEDARRTRYARTG